VWSGRRRLPGLFEQNAKLSFPVALHEPLADYPRLSQGNPHRRQSRLADIAAMSRPRRAGRVRRHHGRRVSAPPIRMSERAASGCCQRSQAYWPRQPAGRHPVPDHVDRAGDRHGEGSSEISVTGRAGADFDTIMPPPAPGSNARPPLAFAVRRQDRDRHACGSRSTDSRQPTQNCSDSAFTKPFWLAPRRSRSFPSFRGHPSG